MLDHGKGRALDCSTCSSAMRALRNCAGKYPTKARILLNGHLYEECPKAIWLEHAWGRYLVQLYIDCRESRILPEPGSMMDQTNFTREMFSFLDDVVAEYRNRITEAQKEEHKKLTERK